MQTGDGQSQRLLRVSVTISNAAVSHVLHFGDSTFRRSHLLDLLEDNLFQREKSMIPRAPVSA